MEHLCSNVFDFRIFFFCSFKSGFHYTLILPTSQLQSQQLMISQISSHVEYLIRTRFYSQNWFKKMTGFLSGFHDAS